MTMMETKNQNSLLTLSLFLIFPLYVRYRKSQEKRISADLSTKSIDQINAENKVLRPPLPKVIKAILSKSRLAYLSTVDSNSKSSHLSLMRFTYLEDEEIIVLSTNVNTKKHRMLQEQTGVALLVHDFGDSDAVNGNYSITLNGDCSIVQSG